MRRVTTCCTGGFRAGSRFPAFRKVIPADFSTAAFPLLAAALAGDGVVIRNLDFTDAQGDKKVFSYFEQMGAKIGHGAELTVGPTAAVSGDARST